MTIPLPRVDFLPCPRRKCRIPMPSSPRGWCISSKASSAVSPGSTGPGRRDARPPSHISVSVITRRGQCPPVNGPWRPPSLAGLMAMPATTSCLMPAQHRVQDRGRPYSMTPGNRLHPYSMIPGNRSRLYSIVARAQFHPDRHGHNGHLLARLPPLWPRVEKIDTTRATLLRPASIRCENALWERPPTARMSGVAGQGCRPRAPPDHGATWQSTLRFESWWGQQLSPSAHLEMR